MPPAYKPADRGVREGEQHAFFTGVDPGWATTDLAIAALACADRVDCVRVQELGWFGDYSSEFSMREYFGFGHPTDFVPILVSGGFLKQMWAPTLLHIADALGVDVDGWNVLYEADSLDHDVQTGFGIVEAGTASVVHFAFQALAGGNRPVAIVEHADRVSQDPDGGQALDAAPMVPTDLAYRVAVEGDPGLRASSSALRDRRPHAVGDAGAQRHSRRMPSETRSVGPLGCSAVLEPQRRSRPTCLNEGAYGVTMSKERGSACRARPSATAARRDRR